MDINNLLASITGSTNQSNAQMQSVSDMLGAALGNQQKVTDKVMAGAQGDIGAAQALAGQSANVDYQRAQLVQQLQSQANLDPAVAENAYQQSLADLTELTAQRRAAASEVSTLASTDLLSDPLGFIMAQLKLPVAQAKAAGLDEQTKIVTEDVSTRLNLLASAKSTVTANTADQVKQIAVSAADLKAREAARNLELASAESASKIAGQYLQQVGILDKINDNKRSLVSMQIQAAEWAANMAARAEARQEKIEAKAKAKEEEASLEAGLAAASKLLGYPRALDLKSFKLLPNSPQKKAIAELAATGTLGAGLAESIPTLQTAGANLDGIRQGGNAGFAATIRGVNSAANDYGVAMQAEAAAQGKKLSAKDAITAGNMAYEIALVDSAVNKKATKPITDPTWDVKFNPYRAQYKVMLDLVATGKAPEIANGVMADAVKSTLSQVPATSSNFRGEDENTTILTVANLVGSGKIDANEAARQVSLFYKASAAQNLGMYQYNLLGLPVQTNYMAKLRLPGTFGDTIIKADLMDEMQVKKLLLELSIKAKQAAAPLSIDSPFFFGQQAAAPTTK